MARADLVRSRGELREMEPVHLSRQRATSFQAALALSFDSINHQRKLVAAQWQLGAGFQSEQRARKMTSSELARLCTGESRRHRSRAAHGDKLQSRPAPARRLGRFVSPPIVCVGRVRLDANQVTDRMKNMPN